MLAAMGMKDTGPGYWRATPNKLELFQRNPSEPAPPFRLSWGWVALWAFLLLLGGLLAYSGMHSLQTGKPLKRGEGADGAALVLLLGLFLASIPFWHFPLVRKEWGQLHPRMTVTDAGVEFHVMAGPHSLRWEDFRGFRVERIRRREELVADLNGLYPNPHKEGPKQTTSITGLSCLEPHSTAFVLNRLLSRPDYRRELGSPRLEAEINALAASAAPAKI